MAALASVERFVGDELDVGDLYKEHGSFIARVLVQLTGDGEHVDDLLQECFLAAFRSRRTYDPGRAVAATWLYGIAANVARRHLRSTWRFIRLRARVRDSEVRSLPQKPDESLLEGRRRAAVQDALARLPFKQREVFVLYEIEGLDGRTIASLVRVPEGTVWTRLHTARKTFARLMRGTIGEEGLE